MPGLEDLKSSWADEVELEGNNYPQPTEVYENNLKICTEYRQNDDENNGRTVKIVRTYKIEKRFVSRSIANRKTWKKFGESAGDKPGPNPATTIAGEDVYMQYITSKEEDNKPEEDGLEKLKALGDKNVVKCRICSGEHWTSKCPWKDTLAAGGKLPDDKKPTIGGLGGAGPGAGTSLDGKPATQQAPSKYIPPGMREGAKLGAGSSMGSSMFGQRRGDEQTAIRVANLSENTTDGDLEELVKRFGPTLKIYLAKDKQTGACKGYAYVHYKFRSDAAEAIAQLNGHGYDHLILQVDWSKPQQQHHHS